MSGGKTMRALVLRKHGGLDDLALASDYPVPVADAGHVVIRVRASSFNYHDVFTVRGMPGIKVPLPVVIGLDMAGEITQLGPGVDRGVPEASADRRRRLEALRNVQADPHAVRTGADAPRVRYLQYQTGSDRFV